MSDFFNDNEFESFLQQQVKHHRMYPSDAVWKGIHQQLHGQKKWPGLYFIAILMVAALSVCTIFMDSTPIVYSHQQSQVVATSGTDVHRLDPAKATLATLEQLNKAPIAQVSGALTEPIAILPDEVSYAPEERSSVIAVSSNSSGETISRTPDKSSIVSGDNLSTATLETFVETQIVSSPVSAVTINEEAKESKPELESATTSEVTEEPTQEDAQIPVLANKRKKSSKWQYEVYITPSTNYKKTVDQKPTTDQFSGPFISNYGIDAAQVIRYKPGMGIEFGLGGIYNATKRLNLKVGFQYNIRQYNIEAYAGNYEATSISVMRYGHINRVPTVSKFRATGVSYDEALLLNKYHQVSIPVGLEYALLNSEQFRINLGGSIQPTYTFSQSSYLLTSDYKSYADGLSMIRRWNINSSLEVTFSYRVGDFQWKFGPQLRYQHLPTYTSKYPIKEYLIDYGFKIGFTKTIQ